MGVLFTSLLFANDEVDEDDKSSSWILFSSLSVCSLVSCDDDGELEADDDVDDLDDSTGDEDSVVTVDVELIIWSTWWVESLVDDGLVVESGVAVRSSPVDSWSLFDVLVWPGVSE